jgi:ankyrin repeat protein
MISADYGNDDAVIALLAHGANPNLVNYFDKTALHYAAENDNPTVIELLLNHGAVIHTHDRNLKKQLKYMGIPIPNKRKRMEK